MIVKFYLYSCNILSSRPMAILYLKKFFNFAFIIITGLIMIAVVFLLRRMLLAQPHCIREHIKKINGVALPFQNMAIFIFIFLQFLAMLDLLLIFITFILLLINLFVSRASFSSVKRQYHAYSWRLQQFLSTLESPSPTIQ